MPRIVRCPHCQSPVQFEENPHRPFCSERCKKMDLGTWAAGGYAIPGKSLEVEEDSRTARETATDLESDTETTLH